MKFAVGVMLTTFRDLLGWRRSRGRVAPGSDASIIGLLVYVLGISALLVPMF